MIRAHMFGVKALEDWAVARFQKLLRICYPPLHESVYQLASDCKDVLWLAPTLTGILKTIVAIRSGQVRYLDNLPLWHMRWYDAWTGC